MCLRRRVRQCLLAPVALLLLVPGVAAGQGEVRGRVVIRERAGQVTDDVANAVIYLLPSDGRTLRYGQVKVPISMNGRQFTPHVRVVTPGSAVEYPNQDPFGHNIFSTASGASFDLGTYPNGVSRANVFRKPGAFPIYCNIHSQMTAYVVVVPTPYYVMASADGRWAIAGVAAGRYALHVWHERAPEVVMPLDVTASGVADLTTTLDARGFVVSAHKNKFGRDYTSAGKDRY